MDLTAEEVIAQLKRRWGAPTDQELADRLKLGRSTVTSWRRRGSVPKRFVRMIDGTDPDFGPGPLIETTEEERAATALALLRIIRDYKGVLDDYGRCVNEALIPDLSVRLATEKYHAFEDLAHWAQEMRRRAEAEGEGILNPTPNAALMSRVWHEFFGGDK